MVVVVVDLIKKQFLNNKQEKKMLIYAKYT